MRTFRPKIQHRPAPPAREKMIAFLRQKGGYTLNFLSGQTDRQLTYRARSYGMFGRTPDIQGGLAHHQRL